jgi:phosphoribosylformylglycinamidine synthase
MSVIITAFAPVIDARLTLTPQLQSTKQIGPSLLLFIDLAQKKQRLGGSCVAQVFNQVGSEAPNVESAAELATFWNFIQNGRSSDQKNLFWAYHDRSDGGLLTTVLEMCFAGRLGCELDLSTYSEVNSSDAFVRALFNEELGAVIQIKETDLDIVKSLLTEYGLNNFHVLGKVLDSQEIRINSHSSVLFQSIRHELQKLWSETSYQMQSIRDNPECALAEFNSLSDLSDPGIHPVLTFDPSQNPLNTKQIRDVRPKVAVLREQGVNSHLEMAYAFYKSGFDSVDVHMSDVLKGKVDLDAFIGLACPGGFSYGDVLGAGNTTSSKIKIVVL